MFRNASKCCSIYSINNLLSYPFPISPALGGLVKKFLGSIMTPSGPFLHLLTSLWSVRCSNAAPIGYLIDFAGLKAVSCPASLCPSFLVVLIINLPASLKGSPNIFELYLLITLRDVRRLREQSIISLTLLYIFCCKISWISDDMTSFIFTSYICIKRRDCYVPYLGLK